MLVTFSAEASYSFGLKKGKGEFAAGAGSLESFPHSYHLFAFFMRRPDMDCLKGSLKPQTTNRLNSYTIVKTELSSW